VPATNKRVAVVAVHGVGDHQPFEMAQSVAALLADIQGPAQTPRYSAFCENKCRINVSPVKVSGHAFQPAGAQKKKHHVDEAGNWGPMDSLLKSDAVIDRSRQSDTQSLDHLFMEGQLSQYKSEGPEDGYEVLRMEARRMDDNPTADPKQVHVYDMFWSDLSGVGTAGLRIFGELYQILFHLGSVGSNNVKAAAISLKATSAKGAWRRFDKVQGFAASILARPLPILNLILLAFVAGLLADAALVKISVLKEWIVTAIVGFAVATALWGFSMKNKGRPPFRAFRIPTLTFFGLSAAVLAAFPGQVPFLQTWAEGIECVATAIVTALAFLGAWFIMRAYEKRRPGAMAFFYGLLRLEAIVAAAAAYFCWQSAPEPYLAITFCLRMIELNLWLLSAAWLIFWIWLNLAFVLGWAAVKATEAVDRKQMNPDLHETDRARRTNWTARLTLALPAVLFLLLTFAGWAGLVQVAGKMLPGEAAPDPCCARSTPPPEPARGVLHYHPILVLHEGHETAFQWAKDALSGAGLGYLPILLLLVVAAVLITIWGMLPSVLEEVSPSKDPLTQAKANSFGEWLTDGYTYMRWGGRLIYLGIFSFVPATAAGLIWPSLTAHEAPILEVLGTIVAGGAVGILGFGGSLSKLALGMRPVVRVALDVDNWLREHPRDSNPTARISARYVSLLRYIAQWQGEDKRGYDALIIFAHSQGTVITADLLRFLTAEATAAGGYQHYDPALKGPAELPVYLMTMGCPLRQLYALRFPYLYGYASTRTATLPDPDHLGVAEWANRYRTGDYIGRFLWRDQDPWDLGPWSNGKRVECTIGPGAHTHYWDSRSGVQETLDRLIQRA